MDQHLQEHRSLNDGSNIASLVLSVESGSASALVKYLLSDKPITVEDRELLA
jgi:hypothetical protein